MQRVSMARTGLQISPIGLGMMSYGDPEWRPWILDEAATEPFVRQAVEAGINFFDTADVYSMGASEEVTGRLLRRHFSRREDYVVATKLGHGPHHPKLSRGYVLDSVEGSLRRLGLDHIDIYQIHKWDPETPIDETMCALNDVVRSGKVRYIGASNTRAWQFAKAQHVADLNGWTRFSTMQNHYNLLHREDELELVPLLLDQGVASVPFSPLARGLLARAGTGEETSGHRYETDDSAVVMYGDPDRTVFDRVVEVAEGRGVPPAQVAIAWLLHQPVVTAPIVGATKPHHLVDAVAAVDLKLTPDELRTLTGMVWDSIGREWRDPVDDLV